MNPNQNNQMPSSMPPQSHHTNHQSYLEQMGNFDMPVISQISGNHPQMGGGGGSGPYDMKLSAAQQRRQKNKRRSKNDQEGRTHKCSLCDKTYLSYPALYTHLKTKHADAKGSDGQPLTPLQSGRGRGRPKKNVDPLSEDYFKTKARGGGPTEVTSHFQEVYGLIYPITIFKNQNNKESVINKMPREYGHYTNHPIYKILLSVKTASERNQYNAFRGGGKSENMHQMTGFHHEPHQQAEQEVMGDKKKKSQSPKSGEQGFQKKNQQQKEEIKGQIKQQNDVLKTPHLEEDEFRSCDQLICEYLGFLASTVNSDYYKSVLKFAILYRECLNDFGWQKKYESISRVRVDEIKSTAEKANQPLEKDPQQLFQEEFAKLMEKDQMNDQFVIVNNGQYAPEVCNEFVTFYWENFKHIALSREDAIDLTRNFCSWLFLNCYTCSKLTIINQVNGEQNSNGVGGGMEDELDNQNPNYGMNNGVGGQENEGLGMIENSGSAGGNYSSLFNDNPQNPEGNNMCLNDEEMQQQQQQQQQQQLNSQNDCLVEGQLQDVDQVVVDGHEEDEEEDDGQQGINFEGGGQSA